MKIRSELKWLAPIALVCLVLFANSLRGEFVYDDERQILRNSLIQDNSLIGKALTSDVWAFKGDGTIVASNYWRPTFTFWHILNFRLFGASPYGWHVLNILLHAGVCLLIYALLRRWAFTPMIACAITLIFAVHPVHVESVAWISGSPDLLFALAFLGSLWFAQTFSEKRERADLIVSLVLYAIALGAKEIGIVCLPVYYLVMSRKKIAGKKQKAITAPLLLFGAVAALYFVIRLSILGAVSRAPEGAVDPGTAILSIPSMFAFYLRQIFFPYWLGANYPLEPVAHPGLFNLVIPLLVGLAAIAAIVYLIKKAEWGRLAAALLFLPLVPAMNATAFIPDQIVHDRYLYLPLLGMLMLVVPFAARFIKEQHVFVGAAAISLVLCFQTFTYNRAWASDLALWSWTAGIDRSSFTSMQYAYALAEEGRNSEAIQAFSDSINRRPMARSYLGRGRVLTKERRYSEAERDLLSVLQTPSETIDSYALYQTYESLGITYTEQRKYDEAIAGFREGRKRLPIYAAALTVDAAIVLYQQGRKDEALRELEGARAQARKELLPESKSVFLRLGMLYAELGRRDDARGELREYLRLTSSINDQKTLADRAQANRLLQSLGANQ